MVIAEEGLNVVFVKGCDQAMTICNNYAHAVQGQMSSTDDITCLFLVWYTQLRRSGLNNEAIQG